MPRTRTSAVTTSTPTVRPARAGRTPTSRAADPLDFTGFPPAGLAFLREVATRQDREWVAAHKADYERHVKAPMTALLVATMTRCVEAGLPLVGDPTRSLFRLHRDTRFSADKRPFHEHASAVLTRTGEKRSPGVLYVHVAPAGSFAAAGFYQPDPAQLAALRAGMVASSAAWVRMTKALDAAGLALDTSDMMVRGPRGFERAPATVQEALRLRSLIVLRPLRAAELRSPTLPERLAEFATAAMPLLRFGWTALGRTDAGASPRRR